MRITNSMMSDMFLKDMNTNLENLSILQKQRTSGKNFSKPSDDPASVIRAMQLHSDINSNNQYNKNINNVINWLDVTDTALDQVESQLGKIRDKLILAGSPGNEKTERKAIKDEINEIIGSISQSLNTNFDGKYVFSGTRVTAKPTDVVKGTALEGAVSNTIDLSGTAASLVDGDKKLIANLDIEIEFDNDQNGSIDTTTEKKTLTIAKDTEINSLSDLANEINNAIRNSANPDWLRGNLKAVPDDKNNTIKFINMNTDIDKKVTPFKIKSSSLGITTEKDANFNESNTTNTRLIYSGKTGGELVDGNEIVQIQQKLKAEISQGVVMEYNVTATEISNFNWKDLDGTDKKFNLKDMLANIVNHLDGKNDDGTSADNDAIKKLIKEDLNTIDGAIDNILKIRSEVGAKQNRMDNAKDMNEENNFNIKEILSNTEDVNIVEKTMEFSVLQSVYIASLQTSAKVLQPTLMDYLR